MTVAQNSIIVTTICGKKLTDRIGKNVKNKGSAVYFVL